MIDNQVKDSVTVLLVEDELMASQMVSSQLVRLGHEVVGVTGNVDEALSLVDDKKPDLVLMDMQMTDPQTGEEDMHTGIRATRAILERRPTPVVVLTAYETEELVREASQAGAVGYLVKPANDNELRRAIFIALARFDDWLQLRKANDELARMNAELEDEIGERRRAEDAEREQRVLAEALRDAMAALNSSLEFNEVIRRIMTSVERVVPHDSASLMRITEGIAQTIGYHGYGESDSGENPTSISVRIRDIPNLQWILDHNQPLVIPETNDNNWVCLPTTEWVHSYVGVPLRARDKLIGYLSLHSATPGFFTPLQAERLQIFADQAAIAIENAHLYSEVQRLAIIDELTGFYNRRGLIELGQREVERVRRFNRPLAAIFLDIDHFKQVNDTYGHKVGDEVLSELATLLRSEIREIDLPTRYGGEEFALLLPENNLESAWQVAERLRTLIARHVFNTSQGSLRITISVGIATASPETPNLFSLIEQADQAMYAAKQAGRNRVAIT